MHPHTQEVFVTLTNGSGNSAPVNSGRDPNPYGHIIRFNETPGSRDYVADMVRKGRDLELIVLSRAVRVHLEDRVLVYGNKTVVFD